MNIRGKRWNDLVRQASSEWIIGSLFKRILVYLGFEDEMRNGSTDLSCCIWPRNNTFDPSFAFFSVPKCIVDPLSVFDYQFGCILKPGPWNRTLSGFDSSLLAKRKPMPELDELLTICLPLFSMLFTSTSMRVFFQKKNLSLCSFYQTLPHSKGMCTGNRTEVWVFHLKAKCFFF